MAVLGSALHAPLVTNNYLTSYQTLQTDSYAYTLWDELDWRISQDDHLTLLPLDPLQVWSPASAERGDEPYMLPRVSCQIPVSSNCSSLLCITIEADKQWAREDVRQKCPWNKLFHRHHVGIKRSTLSSSLCEWTGAIWQLCNSFSFLPPSKTLNNSFIIVGFRALGSHLESSPSSAWTANLDK